MPVHVVAARLGHADPAITLRVYAHAIRQHMSGVGEAFAAQLDQAEAKGDDQDDEDPPAPAGVPC